MGKYLVRHAVVQYTGKNDAAQDTTEVAFRSMVVDLPDGPELDRLVEFGAVVPEGEPLTRPGSMLVLPETATDAEILSWVIGATNEETADLVRQRPAMADRILAAEEGVKARFAEQAKHLGGLKSIAEEATPVAVPEVSTDNSGGVTPAPQASTTPTPAVNSPGDVANPAASGSSPLSDEDADKVVKGSAKDVTEYVSENPRNAQAILAAENRRSEETRVSVVKAVQAAASFGA